jgi:hypothetical protein
MNSKTKALVNYYVRLIQKETYTIEDVPEGLQSEVSALLEAAKPAEPAKDVVTE